MAAIELRRAGRGTRPKDEIDELLRAGLAAADDASAGHDDCQLPTLERGRALISDLGLLSDLLDEQDVARAMPARS